MITNHNKTGVWVDWKTYDHTGCGMGVWDKDFETCIVPVGLSDNEIEKYIDENIAMYYDKSMDGYRGVEWRYSLVIPEPIVEWGTYKVLLESFHNGNFFNDEIKATNSYHAIDKAELMHSNDSIKAISAFRIA